MKAITEKQILEWKEELGKQIRTKNQAQKVFEDSVRNINVLEGGIQFGELLLKKNVSLDQQSNTVEPNPPTKKAPSKK